MDYTQRSYGVQNKHFSNILDLISGLLEISPVERGIVTIFGVRSGLFLAMNSKGKLYGSVSIHAMFSGTYFWVTTYFIA